MRKVFNWAPCVICRLLPLKHQSLSSLHGSRLSYCTWYHVQLKLVKAASLRLKQYISLSNTPINEIQSNFADFDLVCDSGGFITLTDEFCCLNTIISSDHRDRPAIDQGINQASKSFGSLRSSILCNEKQLSPIIIYRLFYGNCHEPFSMGL